ncbi:MAG: shikimate kinase [Chloroflexota bacterium]
MFSASIDQNLILTGYIGPGQLVVARRTAERLRMPFVDFESILEERADLSGEEMRIRFGEARLKTLESELVSEVMLYRGTVIHISGKTLGANFERLSGTGPIICVVATLDAVLRRLHLALGARYHNPNERELALGTLRREWAIRKQRGINEIDTSYLSEDQTVEAIAACWREKSGVIDWRGVS